MFVEHCSGGVSVAPHVSRLPTTFLDLATTSGRPLPFVPMEQFPFPAQLQIAFNGIRFILASAPR